MWNTICKTPTPNMTSKHIMQNNRVDNVYRIKRIVIPQKSSFSSQEKSPAVHPKSAKLKFLLFFVLNQPRSLLYSMTSTGYQWAAGFNTKHLICFHIVSGTAPPYLFSPSCSFCSAMELDTQTFHVLRMGPERESLSKHQTCDLERSSCLCH